MGFNKQKSFELFVGQLNLIMINFNYCIKLNFEILSMKYLHFNSISLILKCFKTVRYYLKMIHFIVQLYQSVEFKTRYSIMFNWLRFIQWYFTFMLQKYFIGFIDLIMLMMKSSASFILMSNLFKYLQLFDFVMWNFD